MQINLPKRLPLGNPNPRLSWNCLLPWAPTLPQWCCSWVWSIRDQSHILTWQFRRAVMDGGSCLTEESACQRAKIGWRPCIPSCNCHQKIAGLVSPHVWLSGHQKKLQSISDRYLTCVQVNAKNIFPPGQWSQGMVPGKLWEMDFTEVQPGLCGYKYLLVFVSAITSWVDAFHFWTEMVQVAAKKLVMEIILRFHLPTSLGSDSGLAFMAKLSQLLSKAPNINWELRCMLHPQSSAKCRKWIELQRRFLTKCPPETGANWLTSCLMSFSESDVPTAEKSSSQLGNLLIPWAQAGLFSDCPTPISESLKGLQLTLDKILPWIPPRPITCSSPEMLS